MLNLASCVYILVICLNFSHGLLSVTLKGNKIQSETVELLPCFHLANWTKYTHRLWFWSICSIMWKHDVIHKTGSTQLIALPSNEDRATATGNMYRRFDEIWTCGFWDMRAGGQTDRHTDTDRNTPRLYRWWNNRHHSLLLSMTLYCNSIDSNSGIILSLIVTTAWRLIEISRSRPACCCWRCGLKLIGRMKIRYIRPCNPHFVELNR